MHDEELRDALADAEAALTRARQAADAPPENPLDLARGAAALFKSRRRRDAHFPKGLFNEYPWDMLLVLFRAWPDREEFRMVDLFTQAGVPQATAVRTLEKLEKLGLVEKHIHENRQKTRVRLTDDALERMRCFLSAA